MSVAYGRTGVSRVGSLLQATRQAWHLLIFSKCLASPQQISGHAYGGKGLGTTFPARLFLGFGHHLSRSLTSAESSRLGLLPALVPGPSEKPRNQGLSCLPS